MSTTRSLFIESHLRYMSRLRIAIRIQGEGDPLLLINGSTRPMQSWDAVISELPGRTVVSFDAPGMGESSTPLRPLSIAELARVTGDVMDAAGLDDATVLGFSHGGAVAQQLAHEAPDRVRGLILAATSCGVGSIPGTRQGILRSLGMPLGGKPWPLPDPLGLLWQSLAVSSWSSVPFLGSIMAPTLVVCGGRDSVVPPSNSRVLARRIPNASLIELPGRGHDLQRGEAGKALARIVAGFLPPKRVTGGLRTPA
jgi:pimeloyl-ACP methyl ester carboxylesterase